ncbi:MAG: class I tRNA ligase family protein, partial [Promicromonosporaceae bacterium]|nr:class I tRNA ligase family protein [Promicromonosporaceae bacterium]
IDTVTSPLDKYILAKTSDLVTTVTAQLDAYDIPGACESIRVFLDILTNWYVRTQRDRFWIEDQTAFDTLYSVLETLCRVTAPLAPLTVEEIWRGLTGQRSIHLTDWPGGLVGIGGEGSDPATAPDITAWVNPSLVSAMDEVRAVVSTALSLRKAHQMRVRQPLARLMLAVSDPAALAPYRKLLQTELNVKAVELMPDDDAASSRFGIAERLAVLARIAGPRLGKRVQEVIKATKAGKWQHGEDGGVIVETETGAVPLQPEEFTLETVVAGAPQPSSSGATQPSSGAESPDLATPTTGPTHVASVLPKGGFVVLDLGMTAELKAEGYARDAIREIQDTRKRAGLDVADRIALTLFVPDEHLADIDAHRILIQEETLATTLSIVPADAGEPLAVQVEKDTTGVEFGRNKFDTDD